ncbi:MAG: prolipoprotein diacylglyceryl transferase [Christensenellaceae bacterium]|nr:prolipoprotein diacylglyceryl transferase [Christensenellaceae bacterium]
MKNPDPILINNLFGIDWLDIHWYGLLIVVGIIIAIFLADHEVKRRKLPPDTAIDLCLVCIPSGLIGARLYYVIFSLDQFHSISDVLNIMDGGLAIYGMLIGGLLGAFIYMKVKRLSFLHALDIILPCVAIAQAIGRWGNFFNQEAFGPVVTNPNHMWFPLAVKIDRLNELHYATFFYESMWCLLVFIVLWFIVRKKAKHLGDVALVYVILYGLERMFVELMRTDSLMLGSVRVSHILSLILCVGGIAFAIIRYIKETKIGYRIWPRDASYSSAGDSQDTEDSVNVEAAEFGTESENPS